jgi:hypothetical protein
LEYFIWCRSVIGHKQYSSWESNLCFHRLMVSRCTGCCCSCMLHYRWKQGKWGWVASCLCLCVQSLAWHVVCGQVARERLEAKTTPDLDANNFFVNLLRRQGTLLAILCFQCSPEVCHLLSDQGETYKLVVLFFTGYTMVLHRSI